MNEAGLLVLLLCTGALFAQDTGPSIYHWHKGDNPFAPTRLGPYHNGFHREHLRHIVPHHEVPHHRWSPQPPMFQWPHSDALLHPSMHWRLQLAYSRPGFHHLPYGWHHPSPLHPMKEHNHNFKSFLRDMPNPNMATGWPDFGYHGLSRFGVQHHKPFQSPHEKLNYVTSNHQSDREPDSVDKKVTYARIKRTPTQSFSTMYGNSRASKSKRSRRLLAKQMKKNTHAAKTVVKKEWGGRTVTGGKRKQVRSEQKSRSKNKQRKKQLVVGYTYGEYKYEPEHHQTYHHKHDHHHHHDHHHKHDHHHHHPKCYHYGCKTYGEYEVYEEEEEEFIEKLVPYYGYGYYKYGYNDYGYY